MSNQKEITGKAVKRILLQEEFLINEMPIATFERDEFGSIIRVMNVKTNQPDHVYLELPAIEDDILSFLRGHYKNQRNDLPNKKKKNALRFNKNISTKALASADVNKDGKIDLFFGERYDLTTYGKEGSGALMINDGQNNFTQSNQKVFSDIGMITDSKFHDFNGDKWPDLIIVGEWMPITILINKNGVFENQTDLYKLNQTSGLWNTLELIDINNDGKKDFIAGNHGTNSFLEKKMRMYINDFDDNGSFEQIICLNRNGDYYPILDKDELMNQLPKFKKNIIFSSTL